MAALNACVLVGYVAGAAVNGITLEKLEIETTGELDLRGFLGIDDSAKPGYDSLEYVVRIKGNGAPEQFNAIHENVIKTSPNYFNLSDLSQSKHGWRLMCAQARRPDRPQGVCFRPLRKLD